VHNESIMLGNLRSCALQRLASRIFSLSAQIDEPDAPIRPIFWRIAFGGRSEEISTVCKVLDPLRSLRSLRKWEIHSNSGQEIKE
jgi:hypothetical protein